LHPERRLIAGAIRCIAMQNRCKWQLRCRGIDADREHTELDLENAKGPSG